MKVISVNVGAPKSVEWKGQNVTTSIFKNPIEGPVRVKHLGLVKDSQSDLKVHGGALKAVYAYPSEHYVYWEKELPDFTFQWGTFGENLTISGLDESDVCLGDIYRIGTVELKVVQPRFPCKKLGMRFDDSLMIKRFLESRKSGFYFEVLQEGSLKSGDNIDLLEKVQGTTIRTFVDLYASKSPDSMMIKNLLKDPHLIEGWTKYFEDKLAKTM